MIVIGILVINSQLFLISSKVMIQKKNTMYLFYGILTKSIIQIHLYIRIG